MDLQLRPLAESDSKAWERFVDQDPGARPYHRLAWRDLLAREYGFLPVYRAAWRADEIAGVLPLFRVRNLAGRKLVSVPLSMYGGPLAADEEVRQALVDDAVEQAEQEGSRLVLAGLEQPVGSGSRAADTDCRIALAGMDDEQHRGQLPDPVGRQIRKSERLNLQLSALADESDLEALYRILLAHRRALGLTVPRRRFLSELLTTLAGGMLVARTEEGRPVGGLLYLIDPRCSYVCYFATDPGARNTGVADRLVWELCRLTRRSGAAQVFLGGSPAHAEGLRRFKRKWGEEHPLSVLERPEPEDRHGELKRQGHLLMRVLPAWVHRRIGRLAIRSLY